MSCDRRYPVWIIINNPKSGDSVHDIVGHLIPGFDWLSYACSIHIVKDRVYKVYTGSCPTFPLAGNCFRRSIIFIGSWLNQRPGSWGCEIIMGSFWKHPGSIPKYERNLRYLGRLRREHIYTVYFDYYLSSGLVADSFQPAQDLKPMFCDRFSTSCAYLSLDMGNLTDWGSSFFLSEESPRRHTQDQNMEK